jgi:hypothetical protein
MKQRSAAVGIWLLDRVLSRAQLRYPSVYRAHNSSEKKQLSDRRGAVQVSISRFGRLHLLSEYFDELGSRLLGAELRDH